MFISFISSCYFLNIIYFCNFLSLFSVSITFCQTISLNLSLSLLISLVFCIISRTINYNWWWASSYGALRSMEYLFIAITPRSTLTQCDSTCYESNRSIWKLLVLDRNTWDHSTLSLLLFLVFSLNLICLNMSNLNFSLN